MQHIIRDIVACLKCSHVFMASEGGTMAVLHVEYILPTIVKIRAIIMLRTRGIGKILEGIEKGTRMSNAGMKKWAIPAPLRRCIHPAATRMIKGTLMILRIRFSKATILRTSCVCHPRAFMTPISRLLSDKPNPAMTPMAGMARANTMT